MFHLSCDLCEFTCSVKTQGLAEYFSDAHTERCLGHTVTCLETGKEKPIWTVRQTITVKFTPKEVAELIDELQEDFWPDDSAIE